MKKVCLGFFLLFFLSAGAEGRTVIDVTGATIKPTPIIMSKWKSADRAPASPVPKKVYEILSNDLTLSGYFKVTDYEGLPASLQRKEGIPERASLQEWMPAGGEFLLAGESTFESDGLKVRLRFGLFDLVDQKVLGERSYEGPFQNLREMVHRMADEVIFRLTNERGVNNTKMAYVFQQPGGGKEIFVCDFDGAGAKPVTHHQGINISPAWMPDGRRIGFTSYLKRNPDLYVVDLDGKNLQRLSERPGLNAGAVWSPDGKQIALMVTAEGKSEVAVMDSSGGNLKVLTKGHGNEASPTWSPDSRSIAFVSDRSGSPQIYVMAADGSGVRRLTYSGTYNTNPAWSPKGDLIAFCGRVGGRFEIHTIKPDKPDGTEVRRLTPNAGDSENPTWSPDGRYIAFGSSRGGGKIYVMNAKGFNQRPLTNSKGGESNPAWSRRFE
jgi:TolB protein